MKKTELLNSEILYLLKFPSCVTRKFKIKKKKKTKSLSYVIQTSDFNPFITRLQ